MAIDWGLILILGVGILIGGLLFGGPEFRRKFFVGLRKFIAGLGSGQKRAKGKDIEENDNHHTQRRYVRTIKMIQCPTCKGKKKVPAKAPGIMDKRLIGMVKCPTCGGTGEVEE